jgi:ribosomal-protein-alanine N-acetyltransferase
MNCYILKTNTATEKDIFFHLKKCNHLFVPPLDTDLDIKEYSKKIKKNAYTFEAWNDNSLIGLVACYLNNPETNEGYITNVSVVEKYHGHGIAKKLLMNNLTKAKQKKFTNLKLEVQKNNRKAIQLYSKLGFSKIEGNKNPSKLYMSIKL